MPARTDTGVSAAAGDSRGDGADEESIGGEGEGDGCVFGEGDFSILRASRHLRVKRACFNIMYAATAACFAADMRQTHLLINECRFDCRRAESCCLVADFVASNRSRTACGARAVTQSAGSYAKCIVLSNTTCDAPRARENHVRRA